jgi:hypothetical protein
MSKRFLHIGFNWSGEPKINELKPVFDNAIDWLRYTPNCWIVWTSSDPEKWYERVKPYLGTGDHVFICAVDMETRQGWLPKTTWAWIDKERSP